MENVERSHAIANSMENLRFDRKGYFYVLVFYGLFYKGYRNTCGTLGELWEYEKFWENKKTLLEK